MTNPGINTFLSNINANKGLAKSERFYVFLTPPTLLSNGLNNAQSLQYQCEATELPGRNLEFGEYRRYGYIKKLATGRSYHEQVLTFLVTNTYYERDFFDNWLELVSPFQDGYDLNYKDDYVGNIVVTTTDQSGQDAYSVTLQRAWPFAMHSQPLNWQDDSFVRLTIGFNYDKWEKTGTYLTNGLN